MSTMQDSLAKLNGFLEGVRKEAAEEPNNVSHMATSAATPAAMSASAPKNDSPEGSAVSREKSDEAEAAGGNVDSTPDNTDAGVPAAQVPETNDGTVQMASDTPVTGSGQMGAIKHQETGNEQKVASLQRTIGIVTDNLRKLLDKQAAEDEPAPMPAAVPAEEKTEDIKKKAEKKKADEGVDKALEKLQAEMKATDPMCQLEKWANDQAVAFRDDLVRGALLRVQDEISLKEAMDLPTFPKEAREAIEQLGGPSEFLDKVAMENPDSILPPEVDGAEGAEGAEGLSPEMIEAGMPAVDDVPAEGGLPVEGELPMEGGEGEISPEELAAIEQMLAEAGVTEEDLMAAQGDLDQLAGSGASPEEAAMAMDALAGEELGEKVASNPNERVQSCIDFLRARRDERSGK